MEFYIAVAYTDPNDLCEIARTAEAAGFGGIIVSDHLIYPGDLRTPYPYTSHGRPRWEVDTPWPDPLLAVGATQLRGAHQFELAKLLCRRARVESLAGDPIAAIIALHDAETIAADLGVAPESELLAMIAELRTLLDGE